VRGVIASRTTMSPNSKIEWISSRSSLDGLFVGGHVGHLTDLLFADERTLLQPSSREQDVGETDQTPGERAQRREVRQERENRRHQDRSPIRVLDREGLRYDLEEHEEDRDLDHDAEHEPDRAEVCLEQDTREVGGHQLAHEDDQQQRVERPLRSFEQTRQPRRPAPAILLEGQRTNAAHPRERRLGHGEDAGDEEQRDDRRDE